MTLKFLHEGTSSHKRDLVVTKQIFNYYNNNFSLEITSKVQRVNQKYTFTHKLTKKCNFQTPSLFFSSTIMEWNAQEGSIFSVFSNSYNSGVQFFLVWVQQYNFLHLNIEIHSVETFCHWLKISQIVEWESQKKRKKKLSEPRREEGIKVSTIRFLYYAPAGRWSDSNHGHREMKQSARDNCRMMYSIPIYPLIKLISLTDR